MRDLAGPLLALLLTLVALPAMGWGTFPPLPVWPAAYAVLAAVLVLLALLARGGARDRSLLDVLGLLCVGAPFLAFGFLVTGGGPAGRAWWLLLGGILVVAALPARGKRAAAALLVLLFAGGAVLDRAGLETLPPAWNPLTRAMAETAPRSEPPAPVPGLRVGAGVRVPADEALALGEGPGPWWRPADVATAPGPRPVLWILDGASVPDPDWQIEDVTPVSADAIRAAHPLDLDPIDAVLVTAEAWPEDDPGADGRTDALVGFVRGGGLLIGPPPDQPWPAPLGRRLGARGRGPEEAAASRLGLGHVVRARARADAQRLLLDARRWVPEVGTVFDRARVPPAAPAALARWADDPASRRPALGVFAAFVALLALFDWLLPGAVARLAGAAMLAGGAIVALGWLVPAAPGLVTDGVRLDLGGPGGRRIEAVFLSAGPQGHAGAVRWRGGGLVRLLGGGVDPQGAVRLPPRGTAWVVREAAVRAPEASDREHREAGFLLDLLEGQVDPKRARLGRGAILPLAVEGADPIVAWTLRYRPGAP